MGPTQATTARLILTYKEEPTDTTKMLATLTPSKPEIHTTSLHTEVNPNKVGMAMEMRMVKLPARLQDMVRFTQLCGRDLD